ncbi:MAG: glycosyltransferase [Schleiferiaceae bacterium]|nr:glycosyltransferase [Schleiferiaceae bacterium]
MRRKKVLIITTNIVRWGGSEELWADVANELLEQGQEVMISVFMHADLHPKILKLLEKGAQLHKRPFPSYFKEQRFTGRALAELKRRTGLDNTGVDWLKVLKFKPQSVLISSGETFDYAISDQSFLVKYCVDKGIPFYLISQFNWEHDMDISESFRTSRRKLVNLSSGNFFVSVRNFTTARRQIAAQIPNARIISNPIHINLDKGLPYPKSDIPKIAVVARYQSFIKGQDLLLEALSSSVFSDQPFEVSLFGSGNDENYFKELIKFYNLEANVSVAGSVEDVSNVWRTHQFFVLPSRAEGTSLAMLEAMACGRTGLVTQAGDSALWMMKNGFFAENNTKEALQKTLLKAFSAFSAWEKMGMGCREVILKNHLPNQAKQLADLLVGTLAIKSVGYDPKEFLELFE